MRHHRHWIIAATLVIVEQAAFYNSAGAGNRRPSEYAGRLCQWNQGLRAAGASPAEISNSRTSCVCKHLPAWMRCGNGFERLNSLPVSASSATTGGIQKTRSIFQDNTPPAPARACKNVSISNTTIESTAIDVLDVSCRVTASVTHPPAADRVRVFVALPRTSWNGRFRGTGGGGFWGGTEMSLRSPVSKGFVTAATDTGHPGGSGSFGSTRTGA